MATQSLPCFAAPCLAVSVHYDDVSLSVSDVTATNTGTGTLTVTLVQSNRNNTVTVAAGQTVTQPFTAGRYSVTKLTDGSINLYGLTCGGQTW